MCASTQREAGTGRLDSRIVVQQPGSASRLALTSWAWASCFISSFVANKYSLYAVVRFLSLIKFDEICIENVVLKDLNRGLIQKGILSNFPKFYRSVAKLERLDPTDSSLDFTSCCSWLV